MSSERFINCRHPGCEEPRHRGSYCRAHAERFYVRPSAPAKKARVVFKDNGGFKVIKEAK